LKFSQEAEENQNMIYFLLIALPLISASPGYYSYHAQTVGSQPGFQTYINNRRFQNSPRVVLPTFNHLANTYQTFVGRNGLRTSSYPFVIQQTKHLARPFVSQQTKNLASPFGIQQTKNLASTFGIQQTKNVDLTFGIQQTKNVDLPSLIKLSKDLAFTLRDLSAQPSSVTTINQMIRDINLPCISNIEEAIDNLETATELVETVGPEFEALTGKFTGLSQVSDPVSILREAADLMRLMSPLGEKLTHNTDKCQGNFVSLRSLSVLLGQMSTNPALSLSPGMKSQLKQSSSVISSVDTFITDLKSTSTSLENACSDSPNYSVDSLAALGSLMEHLSNLFSSLGDAKTGEKIIQGKSYIDRVVADLRNQVDRNEDLGLARSECPKGGWTASSASLQDLAQLVDDVGIEKLTEQLGTDFSDLDFNFAF